ncbi:Sac2 family-domain-containing protein [Scheffersomyces xylosifermentans]|uniref:Sac2 family-domain-containing protein n=1 Tax=Scheffersomyces xylosifermentans TaxID=1304137 RepID=UPI00315CD16F
MSALQTLKSILPTQVALPETDQPQNSPEIRSLENLQKYIQFDSTNKKNHLPFILEQLRIDVAAQDSGDYDLDSIEPDVLPKLSQNFQDFHNAIKEYRHKLVPIETILEGFHTDLTELSSSLVSLQQQSTKLSADSSLQRTITEKLNPIILDLAISPDVVKSVIHDEVDVNWLDNLKFLTEKSQLIANIKADSEPFRQLEAGIKLLTSKAVERIRDFIIKNIKALRSSTKSSSQTIQQNLLTVKEAYVFLQQQHKELANQLKLAYIFTMRWYYQTRFAKYIYALEKLHIRHVDETFSNHQNATANQLSMSEYLQSIDKRVQVLDTERTPDTNTAMPSQIAETTPFAYWLEFVFNQYSIALIDNIIVEYLFIIEFFYQGNEKFEKVDSLFKLDPNNPSDALDTSAAHKGEWYHVMFNNVFKMGAEFVTWLITHTPSLILKSNSSANTARAQALSSSFGTCDGYAILLMIRLIQNSQSQLHDQFHIPILDDYHNSLLLILWPHFTRVIDLNCEAMKKAVIHKQEGAPLAPVNVTQQFAQFLSGLLKLCTSKDKSKDFKGEPIYTSVNRLRNDFENFLTKLSTHSFGSRKKSTEKEIFLYNNYFLVVSILKNENAGEIPNEFVDDQIKHFELLCDAYSKH